MKNLLIFIFIFVSFSLQAQDSLDNLLKRYNKKEVPYITVEELAMLNKEAFILDAREEAEYNTSHLKNAFLVGYNKFSIDSVLKNIPSKNEKIVVYCSIGIRSEHIALKLQNAGYTHVLNLFGGIFEWKNNDLPVYNSENKETDSIHVFSEKWSKWLKSGIKVY